MRPSVLFLPFQMILAIQSSMRFHVNFRKDFFLLQKKNIGLLVGVALNM